jgi:hypothetical protein
VHSFGNSSNGENLREIADFYLVEKLLLVYIYIYIYLDVRVII